MALSQKGLQILIVALLSFPQEAYTRSISLEGFDPLKLLDSENRKDDMMSTQSTDRTVITHKHYGIKLFKFQWEHVSAPLTIAFWFFTVTITKIIFHRFHYVHSLLPDSALLIILGLFFGYIFHLVYPDEMYLKPDWFFLYLLPPIALDAGYFMPNKNFFRNFGTIMTYAVFGTLWNVFAIGLSLYFLSGYFKVDTSLMELFMFSTLISAVDPVAVLCVFEEIHVNQQLYICVFGESLLNDAVTIVLYQTFNAMIDAHSLTGADYITASSSFFIVSFGGLLIGLSWAIMTGFTTKYSQHLNVVQPLICLLFPYLAYLIAEMVAMSGILAIVICGLAMKQFVVGNLSRKSLVTVQYFMKTLSSSCEALIFVYLGISAVSKNHDWDIVFIIGTVISCLVQRFIGVFFLTYLLNIHRVQKIDLVDQFIMSYGGIRGAVCYGLVMSLDASAVKAKNMFASCTVVVILFTVFIQGGTIKKLVKLLKVKQNDVHKKTVFEMVGENVIDSMMTGIEGVTGYRGQYWCRQTYNKFTENYVKPYLMSNAKSGVNRLIDYHERIQVKEAVKHFKVYGSFVGLPIAQGKSNNEEVCAEPIEMIETKEPRLDMESNGLITPVEVRTKIPRNDSISLFLRDKFSELNSPVSKGVYSRHLLDVDNTPRTWFKRQYFNKGNSFDALENEAYHMTYPYCKNTRIRRQRAYDVTNSDQKELWFEKPVITSEKSNDNDASTSNDSAGKPRFLILNEFESVSKTNVSCSPRRKSADPDLEKLIDMGNNKKLPLLNMLKSSDTITEVSKSKRSQERPKKRLSIQKVCLSKGKISKISLSPVCEVDEICDVQNSKHDKSTKNL